MDRTLRENAELVAGGVGWRGALKALAQSRRTGLGALMGTGYFLALCFAETSPPVTLGLLLLLAAALIVPPPLLAALRERPKGTLALDRTVGTSQWLAVLCACAAPFSDHWLQMAASFLCLCGAGYTNGKAVTESLVGGEKPASPPGTGPSVAATVAATLLILGFGPVDLRAVGFLLPALTICAWLVIPSAYRWMTPAPYDRGQSVLAVPRGSPASSSAARGYFRAAMALLYSVAGAVFLFLALGMAFGELSTVLPPSLPWQWERCVVWYMVLLDWIGPWPTMFTILVCMFVLAGGIELCKPEYNRCDNPGGDPKDIKA